VNEAAGNGIPRVGGICEHPVFIIGSPRSGTTALARALSRHPALWASHESRFLAPLFGKARPQRIYVDDRDNPPVSWFATNKVSQAEFLGCLGLGINALFTSRSGGRRWIDHTPHYTLFAEQLSELFPGALFLHLLRDGRRVVHSMVHFADMFDESRRATVEPALPSYMSDFGEACRTWSQMVDEGSAFVDLHPHRSLTVRNELLVVDPVVEFARILEFIDVPSESGPAEWFSANRVNSSFARSGAQVGPGSTAPNPWDSWPCDWRKTFREEAGSTLVALGMATEDDLRS